MYLFCPFYGNISKVPITAYKSLHSLKCPLTSIHLKLILLDHNSVTGFSVEYQVTTFNYGLVVVRKTQQGDLSSTTADLGKKRKRKVQQVKACCRFCIAFSLMEDSKESLPNSHHDCNSHDEKNTGFLANSIKCLSPFKYLVRTHYSLPNT